MRYIAATRAPMNKGLTTFEDAVNAYYPNLYRFALTLSGREADACDLTQGAFERLLRKPDQLRDISKVKSWLFTTLYRLFLERRREQSRFQEVEIDGAELPSIAPTAAETIDASAVTAALAQVEEPYRAPLILFYLEDHSYREIAEVLGVPIGTVMSRLARGKALLRALLADRAPNVIPFPLKAAS